MEGKLRGMGRWRGAAAGEPAPCAGESRTRVCVPGIVDPLSGYRWYAPDQIRSGRIVARLRRVGLPVAAMHQVLSPMGGATALLDNTHLVRLEQALADARASSPPP